MNPLTRSRGIRDKRGHLPAIQLVRLRTAVRYLLVNDKLIRGTQYQLAKHFRVSRQRVHVIVNQERADLLVPQRKTHAKNEQGQFVADYTVEDAKDYYDK